MPKEDLSKLDFLRYFSALPAIVDAEVKYFGTDSSCMLRRQTCRGFFENYVALVSAGWGKEPSMVRITNRPPNTGATITDPAQATLRNVFRHLAVQRRGKGFKPVVPWQVETTPRELGVLLQYL
jgi:hypothetical protein